MKLKVTAVYDRKVTAYHAPMFTPHVGQAERWFTDQIAREIGSELNKHPNDYELHLIADFDNETGVFSGQSRSQICLGSEIKVG